MTKYLIILYLVCGFLLMLQLAESLPTSTKTITSASEEEVKTADTLKLASESSSEEYTDEKFTHILREVTNMTKNELTRAKNIIEHVLKEASIESVNSVAMQSHKLSFTEFLKETDVILKQADKQENIATEILKTTSRVLLLEEFERIVKKYNTTKLEHPIAEDFLIEAALKKNGLTEFENDRKKLKQQLSIEQNDAQDAILEKYLKNKKSQMEAINEEYLNETDETKKYEIISKIFKLYT